MATYTSNYGLHQWAPEDNFLRTDFNMDLQKIDTALRAVQEAAGEKSYFVSGNYVGDGGTKTVELGFQPRALVLCYRGDIILVTAPFQEDFLWFTETGFTGVRQEYGSYAYFNPNEHYEIYHYLALR